MIKKILLSFLLIILMLFYTKEAYVSQVHEMNFSEPLKEVIISDDVHILIVKDLEKWEPFLKVTLPKRTHYQKKRSSTYEEHVLQFEVISVIRSDKFKKGELFWIWKKPAYSLNLIKMDHEQGILKSPIVRVRTPDYPIEGDKFIVFINKTDKKNEKFPEIFNISLREGVKAEKEIIELFKKEKIDERGR